MVQQNPARHHPNDGLLTAYAAGTLDEPLALLVATHLTLCPECRAAVARLESVGGALLDNMEPVSVSESALASVFERLDGPKADILAAQDIDGELHDGDLRIPQPLRGYLKGDFEGLAWRGRGPVSETELLSDFRDYKTRLMRIRPSAAMPSHTHVGNEVTLVLQGGFSDSAGHYLRGDVAFADPSVDHRPIADPGEECICLAVTDAPLKLTGPIGRFLNPFLRL